MVRYWPGFWESVTEKQILLWIVLLVLVTFGSVAYDQVFKDRGVVCHVKSDTLYCPPGTTWKYTAADRQWDAVRGTYP
jgi:hypothetical protein